MSIVIPVVYTLNAKISRCQCGTYTLYIYLQLPTVLKNKIYAYTSCLIDKKWSLAPRYR